jgi:hypothetical protein
MVMGIRQELRVERRESLARKACLHACSCHTLPLLTPRSNGHERVCEREVVDVWSGGAGTEDASARTIQLAALPRLIGNRQKFCKVTI